MRLAQRNQVLVLELTGELDISTTPPALAALVDAFSNTTLSSVVFDLADVSFMDSSAIKCLVYARNHARSRGGSVVVCNASPRVARVLRVLGLDQQFALYDAPTPSGSANDRAR